MGKGTKLLGGLLCLAVGAGAGTYAGVKVAQHKESTIQTETNQASEDRGYEQGYLDAIAEKEEDISTLENEIETLETEKTELEEQIDELEEALENAVTQEEYDEIAGQLTDAQASLSSAQTQITTLQGQIATLQEQVATLQGQLATAGSSAEFDFSQLADATMIPKANQNNAFYLFLEGSQGLYKVSVDLGEFVSVINTGSNFDIITTESEYDFAIADGSRLYKIDIYGNATQIQLQNDAGSMNNYLDLGKGRAFVSTQTALDETKILVLDTENGTLVNTISFVSENMHYIFDDMRGDVYIISDDGDECLKYCIYPESQDLDQYTTISITAGDELDDIYYNTVVYVDHFIFVQGNDAGGLWRIDWSNNAIIKVSDDGYWEYVGDEEDNGVLYALIETETTGLKINTEDGTSTTYTPGIAVATLTAANWEAPGLTITFDANGNYSIVDEDSKYFDAGDLTGTYTIDRYEVTLSGGNGGEFVMTYDRNGVILYEDEYAGNGMLEFIPAE